MKLIILKNDYVFSIINKILSLFTGFITTALINRYLGPSLKGEYTYIMNIVNLLAIVLNLGVYQSYPKSFRDNVPNIKSRYLTVVYLQCFVYILVSLILGIVSKNLILFLSALMVPSQVLANQLSMIMIVEEVRYRQLIQILSQIVRLFMVAFATFVFKEQVVIVLMIYLLINVYVCFSYIYKLKAKFNVCYIDKKFISYLITFGMFSMASEILLLINYKADILMLKYYVDYYQIGLYSVGAGIAECVWLLPDAFKEVLFSRTSRSNSINEVNFAIRLNMLFSIIVIVGMFMFGRFVITIYSGKEYLDAITVTRIILLGVPSMALFKITNPLYLANGKQRLYCLILAVSAVINIILNLLLIPILEINGAAIASISAFTICGGLFTFFYVKDYQVKVRDLLILNRKDLKKIKEIIKKKRDM